MFSVILILNYLWLNYLLTQLIYARTQSPQKGLFLFHKAWNMAVSFSICFYQSITLLNCQCNVFWPCVAIIITAVIKNDCSYRNNCGIQLHDGDLEQSLLKEKERSSYVFLPIFMFCHSRFRFRNLKDANLSMFSWRITTSSLLICFWHDMTLSHFVQ